jgi:hypothetical protein
MTITLQFAIKPQAEIDIAIADKWTARNIEKLYADSVKDIAAGLNTAILTNSVLCTAQANFPPMLREITQSILIPPGTDTITIGDSDISLNEALDKTVAVKPGDTVKTGLKAKLKTLKDSTVAAATDDVAKVAANAVYNQFIKAMK